MARDGHVVGEGGHGRIKSVQEEARKVTGFGFFRAHFPSNRDISMATLSPSNSPKAVRRRVSTRRRAGSHLPAYPSQESHDAALHAIRFFLKAHTAYDAFPVSFRLIVLDTKLNVKKALQCLLLNGP